MKMISVTDIRDFKLGNAENSEKGTGCTVIICEEGAVGGVDVRGGGPATRETDLLRSENTVNAVNAVVLSGGSAFGLEAASGVMRELAEMKIGFDVGDDIVVPIVCGASLYDLPVGDKAFPDVNMGIQAARNAFEGSFANGNHGAGTGATVGKLKGYDRAMKSGLGTFACGDGTIEVGAIAAVNAVGDIYNGAGNIIAGLRSEDGESIFGTIKTLKSMVHDNIREADENPAHITKADIEEALAAVAKQYKEQESMAENQDVEMPVEEPEAVTEVPAEEPVAKFVFEAPAEEFTEAPAEEIIEEPVEEHIETPAEDIVEEPETVIEEPQEVTEEAVEEAEEEFIPETPAMDTSEDDYREYAEISIPVATAEPEYEEISAAEAVKEPEALCEEPAEEFEELQEEAPEATYEEPAEESAELQEEEPEAEAEFKEVPAEENIEAPEAAYEEPAEESAELQEEAPEAVCDEPDEAPEEICEEQDDAPAFEEIAEETAGEEEQAPLTREEMGYDIVFNTTISCLITNASLTKSQANKLASILHDAYARAIKPVHGTMDGDTVFVLATGKQQVNFDAFAALATDVMQYAIIDGAMSAEGAYGLPAARDMR